ncbi:MAG: hypothetical protein LQ352_002263 [Teloschistes flavicans]|nr:MAG: hypothetical protein LQ352_002263 [Teloschistes flavicans]
MARKARQRISYVHLRYEDSRDPSPLAGAYTFQTSAPKSLRNQIQAHTHWVNDILLTQSNNALVSASSDVSVKVWRPHARERQIPTTIGLHSDYVKCLASPGSHADWVASGALDHKIRIWDLYGGGERLCIDGGEDESNVKGSVYALSVRGSVMASGGPESIVRMWDARTGKRITKLVGHTDNIRDILINQDATTVMTASSDQTVKVWSVAAGRCMYTLNMHNDSVWSLYSDHPQLAVTYSSDRSGLVVKTDLQGSSDWDGGLSLSVAQEQGGVNKVIAACGDIWTATSTTRPVFSLSQVECVVAVKGSSTSFSGNDRRRHRQRESDAATMYSTISFRKMSEAIAEQESGPVLPFQDLPTETIQGQHGLIKHITLNDKRRVLTLDTAGEVVLWDLLKCIPVQSFGKRHLDEVVPEVNTMESVAAWCSVDTRTGKLACILEENNCFDAEMYADELNLENTAEMRDDQRINLGKWILRYLFANLIEEEFIRDEVYRRQLQLKHSRKAQGAPAPHLTQLPSPQTASWQNLQPEDDTLITPRASNGLALPASTPGLAIGVATPHPGFAMNGTNALPNEPTTDQASNLEKTSSNQSQPRSSTDKAKDYFSANPNAHASSDHSARPSTPGEDSSEASTQSPVDGEKEDKPKEGTSLFGKRFRMNMNFPKKLGRTSVEVKRPVADEKAEESDKSEEKEERVIEDNFLGTIQRIRYEYDEFYDPTQPLMTGIFPSSRNETPLLELPPYTTIIIQEDRPDSGGVTDLYRGTVFSAGQDADQIEKSAPIWLGDLLLRICAYVAERIEPQSERPDPNALKPEEYLELYCQDKV